jgi:hypothetical protein
MSKRTTLSVAAALAVVAVALFLAACGDDDDSDDNGQLDDIQVSLERTQVLTVMNALRVEGLHEIDDEAQTASEIEAGWSGAIGRLHQAVAGTTWPGDLAEGGEALEQALGDAHDALEAEDLAAFKTSVTASHDAWHDLEHDAYAFIAGEEHDEGEGDGHDEEASPSTAGEDHE